MSGSLHNKSVQAVLKILVFCLCLVPFFVILVNVWQNNLGPDPVKELSLLTGGWALRFLILTLAITPARRITGFSVLARYRRMIGLFTLYYASWHFFIYLMFLLEFRWESIYEDVLERPYITVGFSAYLILAVLGITSPKVMVKKLGRNWIRLHRFIYLAAVFAIVHLVWIVRSDFRDALLYGFLVALLLGYRLLHVLRTR
ncbi:MAG: protein-methionine-sulfoxide reductase heme-binding subunit MsrQ [Pseudohongiellaceae bacterium]